MKPGILYVGGNRDMSHVVPLNLTSQVMHSSVFTDARSHEVSKFIYWTLTTEKRDFESHEPIFGPGSVSVCVVIALLLMWNKLFPMGTSKTMAVTMEFSVHRPRFRCFVSRFPHQLYVIKQSKIFGSESLWFVCAIRTMAGQSAPIFIIPSKSELWIALVGIATIPRGRSRLLNDSIYAVIFKKQQWLKTVEHRALI